MRKTSKILIQLLLVLILVGAGALGFYALKASKKPVAQKKPQILAPLVRVVKAVPQTMASEVMGEGTVSMARKSSLSAEVGGRVVFVSPGLVAGGQFKKGMPLLSIDPSNYEIQVTLTKAKIKEAETLLKTAREEAVVAKEEWRRLLSGQRQKEPSPLVLREPQMEEAQARLQAARASLEKARLDLSRCMIKAPFDGIVEAKHADLGQYLNMGAKVADLYGTDSAEIVVPLENKDLAWISVPHLTPNSESGSPTLVSAAFAGKEHTWQGRVVRAEALVDPATRLVPVVVEVKKPYAKLPPLASGLFVTVAIKGKTLNNVYLIPRTAVKQGNIAWVTGKDGVLRFKKLTIARFQGNQAVVSQGLENGDLVITSHLQAVSDGMKVRTVLNQEEKNL